MNALRYLLTAACCMAILALSASCEAPHSPTASPTPAAGQPISAEIAFLMIGLITDSMNRPDVNALDTYAAASHWDRNPPEINALVNAKVGYHGMLDGHKVLIGGDGTNDIFAATINEGFEETRVVGAFHQAFTVRPADTDESAGQRTQLLYLSDHGRDVGVLMITYGIAEAIRGHGTVAFISMKKAREATGKA